MQQLWEFKTIWYFALGSPEKTSLCSQFCRENNFLHFISPQAQFLKPDANKHSIIEGSLDLFRQIQKIKPQLSVILVGKPINNQEKQICDEYEKIGRFKRSPTYKYQQFRKIMYPNLIFIYGPKTQQNNSIAITLSANTGYQSSILLKDANQFISKADKCTNLIVNGLFEDSSQVRILAEYFNIKIIHLKYNRVDLSEHNEYFDKEFNLVQFLKEKPYYIPVDASKSEERIVQAIGEHICPKLLYAIAHSQQQHEYLQNYANQTEGLILDMSQILKIIRRKHLPQLQTSKAQISFLTSIFYKDFNRKQIIICNFPTVLTEVIALQRINRKISIFIDLTDVDSYKFSKEYSTPIYFLETQKWIRPNRESSLYAELKPKINYWIVGGATGSGKSSVAKHLANEFGYKLIEFEPYLASVKEKLLGPDDGEQVPVKKVIEHFRQLLTNDRNSTYVIDGLPYEKKDLQEWIKIIGPPKVINLEVEAQQQIKRSRKKAQADVNAQINEEEATKAKQSTQKNRAWVDKISEVEPSSSIYKVDYNGPQIIAEDSINKILKPRIFFVQVNQTNIFQNIALKYGLGFVNLTKHRLRQCAHLVKACNKRDIIICNHGHEKKRNASEDVYWVEKNLGEIRYLGIWENESKQAAEEVLELQKPKMPEKPKPVEGEAGEQKPPQDPPVEGNEGQANKNNFDIYSYEWTKPGNYKNLTQWFFKSKKNIKQFQSTLQECFNHFGQVLQILNQDPTSHVYQRIK